MLHSEVSQKDLQLEYSKNLGESTKMILFLLAEVKNIHLPNSQLTLTSTDQQSF